MLFRSGRNLWDDFQALWSSWVVESNVNGSAVAESHYHRSRNVKVYFAGDTGYRAVRDGEDENTVPVCPAFKEIGDVFGGFDFAMIPIGLVSYHSFPIEYLMFSPQSLQTAYSDVAYPVCPAR